MIELFAISNFTIAVGYFIFGAVIVPRLRSRWVGGLMSIFFGFCAITHLHLFQHAAEKSAMTAEDMGSPEAVLIHVVQAIAVWISAVGAWIYAHRGELVDMAKPSGRRFRREVSPPPPSVDTKDRNPGTGRDEDDDA